MQHRLIALLLFAATPLCAAAAGTIYHCETADGVPRFSQFPCTDRRGEPGAAHGALVLPALQTVHIPPLDAAEQRLLDELSRARQQRRQQHEQARRQAARAAQRERAARHDRCRAARLARDALAEQRRRGYTLAQARRLEQREAELAARERDNC